MRHAILLFILLLPLSLFPNKTCIEKAHNLNEYNFSGDKQQCVYSEKISFPFRATVTNCKGIPISNAKVRFSIVSQPDKSKRIIADTAVYTNKDGLAEYVPNTVDAEGTYIWSANTEFAANSIYFTLQAKKPSWVLLMIFGLLGGLALFMFGMHLMSEGLQKSAGDKMRAILSKLTHNRFIAMAVGAVVTMIIQSSSATSVMLVSFVNSKLMRFKQTLGILLGAAIGTTITAQLIAFKLTDYSLLMIGLGASFYLFTSQEKLKNIGESILGFGILFFGMEIMSDSMYPLRTYEPFVSLLSQLENPLLGILVGAIFTALIQSSSAFIGIMIILASQNMLSIDSSLALLLGANLGTPITAILASIKTTSEAKKVAFALLGYKFILVIIFIWTLPFLSSLYYSYFGNLPSNEVLPRQIANAHTLFNVVLTIIALPFINSFALILDKIIPSKKESESEYKIKYIDNSLFGSPILALNMAKQETLRMGYKIISSMDNIILAFEENKKDVLGTLENKRKEIKFIRDQVRTFLLNNSRVNSNKRNQETFQILHVLNELSHINDEVTKILHRRAEKWIRREYEFSEDGKKEVESYYEKTKATFVKVLSIFDELNLELANKVKKKNKALIKYANELENAHFERLISENKTEMKNSKTHLEIINVFKIINQHVLSIVKVMLDE